MTPLEKINDLMGTYRSMGLQKDAIIRKMKAQFPSAKFSFKGSTLYVQFGSNPVQKVIGGLSIPIEAATRLLAYDQHGKYSPDEEKKLVAECERILKKHGIHGVQIKLERMIEIGLYSYDQMAAEKARAAIADEYGLKRAGSNDWRDDAGKKIYAQWLYLPKGRSHGHH
jgi:hypothetical protein